MKKLSFLSLLIICLTTNATKFYVSPNGNDANNGTSTTTPWKTIAKVNSYQFFPGDVVLFQKGGVWRETLLPRYSGSSGKPITYSAYGTGARPVLNGANVYTGWTIYRTNVWTRNSPLSNGVTPTIRVNGEIYNRVTSIASLVKNTFYIDKSSNPDKIYIYSDKDANSRTIEISTRRNAIYLNRKSYISFINLNVINCLDAGIRLDGDVETDGVQPPPFNGYCIIDSVSASNSVNAGIITGTSYCHTTIRNSCAYSNGNGFYAYENAHYTLFQNDTAYNNYNHNDPFTDGNGIGVYKSSFNTVEKCIAYNNKDGCGIEVDLNGTDSAIVIRYNVVYGNGSASEWYGIKTGNVIGNTSNRVYYNLSYLNGNDSVERMGREFFHHNGNISFYNNTAYTTGSSYACGLTITGYGTVTAKNNIIYSYGDAYGGKYMFCIRRFNNAVLVADKNLYFSNSTEPFYDGSVAYNFSAWKQLKYNDTRSMTANPLFTANGSKFTLKLGSPAIDKGTNVGLTKDILGNPIVGAPDIGAYEMPANSTLSSTSASNVVESNLESSDESFGVYPNPATQILNVRLPNYNAAKTRINIFDITGKKVMPTIEVNKPEGTFSIPVDVAKLSRGIYSINVLISEQTKMSATFLKL